MVLSLCFDDTGGTFLLLVSFCFSMKEQESSQFINHTVSPSSPPHNQFGPECLWQSSLQSRAGVGSRPVACARNSCVLIGALICSQERKYRRD